MKDKEGGHQRVLRRKLGKTVGEAKTRVRLIDGTGSKVYLTDVYILIKNHLLIHNTTDIRVILYKHWPT